MRILLRMPMAVENLGYNTSMLALNCPLLESTVPFMRGRLCPIKELGVTFVDLTVCCHMNATDALMLEHRC